MKAQAEYETVLGQELEGIDRRIRIQRLKTAVEALCGETMMVGGDSEVEEDSPIIEAFWKQVLAYETAPRSTRFAQLQQAGVALPPPDSLSDAELHQTLWEVIQKLAELGEFLEHTDHLSDRGLYSHLWDRSLREEITIMPFDPDSAYHVDILGGCSEEDIQTSLKYYATKLDREDWYEQFPEDPIPEHADPPYDRDRLLPQPRR